MQTIEFETKIVDGVIKIPIEHSSFHNVQAKIIIVEEANTKPSNNQTIDLEKTSVEALDFSKYKITCFKDINPIEYQRETRDAK